MCSLNNQEYASKENFYTLQIHITWDFMNNQHFEISEFKSKSGVKRIFSAFFYSIDGFRTAWKFEHAFRQELMIAIPGIIIAVLMPVT